MDGFFAAILGLVVGSFLNAVIYRLHAKISFFRGRSFCPHCRHGLHAWDLIPLFSFLFLRRRCRYCRKKISWQYPLVELATAVTFVLLWWRFGTSVELFAYFIFTAFLIVIFVYDLRYYLILDKVSIPAMIVGFILSIWILDMSILSLGLGVLVAGGFFLLQYVISRGKWIGGGDIRLGVVMGLMLGFPHVLVALFLAYCLGSIVGIGLILGGQKKWQSQVPFGTFLAVTTIITFLIGNQIIDFYQELLL